MLVASSERIMSHRRSLLSHRLPQTHSETNIPNAHEAARAPHSTIPMPNDSAYSGMTGPLIEIVEIVLQPSNAR